MQGVSGEDKIELNKEEAKEVKLRSRKLLLSLIYPVRGRLLFCHRHFEWQDLP